MKMKVKPGLAQRKGCGYTLPLPIALLLSACFFFAGYYVSIAYQEDTALAMESKQNQRLRLLENGLELPYEYGESGDGTIHDIPFQVLSWAPRTIMFPRFATKLQCEQIIALARTRLAPSGLALRKGETADQTKDVRTSSGTFLAWHQDKTGTLEQIEEKMSKVAMIPRENGEAFNVLRYQLGQKYNCHYDVFNPVEYGPQKTQRIASMLLYLSDVEEGGETMFPFENYQNMNTGYDYRACIGLKVKPRQGDALLFYSIHPNGTFDAAALHGSCPVTKGEKWVATKWMRDNIF
ncbi:unnamed protein product [Calypogeia fissa]